MGLTSSETGIKVIRVSDYYADLLMANENVIRENISELELWFYYKTRCVIVATCKFMNRKGNYSIKLTAAFNLLFSYFCTTSRARLDLIYTRDNRFYNPFYNGVKFSIKKLIISTIINKTDL